jgi:hypothetical protein
VSRGRAIVIALGAALAVGSCAGAPRSFVTDDRVHIESPPPLTTGEMPFTVRWTTQEAAASYAVFIDRSPIGPGRSLRELADDQCRHLRGCPDPAYLAARGVYVTRSTSVAVPVLPPRGGVAGRADRPVHTATVVVLGAGGRRQGDSSWTVEFRA